MMHDDDPDARLRTELAYELRGGCQAARRSADPDDGKDWDPALPHRGHPQQRRATGPELALQLRACLQEDGVSNAPSADVEAGQDDG